MREPPKALGPIGGFGGTGLTWAAEQFHWNWPTWLVLTVATISAICLFWTIGLVIRCLWHSYNDWREHHYKPRLKLMPLHLQIIALSGILLFAGLALAGAIWQVYSSQDATTPAVAHSPATAQPSPESARLIKNPILELDRNRLILRGTYASAGNDLVIYVTYWGLGTPTMSEGNRPLVFDSAGKSGAEPRIIIDAIGRFDKSETAEITVGTFLPVEGNQHVIQWGKQNSGNKQVGVTWASYVGLIIFVTKNGQEDSYPFMLVSRSKQNDPMFPLVLGPSVFRALPN